MMSFVDSHCHLDFPDYGEELDAIVKRAMDIGVTRMVTIGTKLDEIERLLKISEAYPNIFIAVGIHPEYAKEYKDEGQIFEKICSYASHPKVIGIGETGLDYHYGADNKEIQKEVFRIHLKAAKQTKLPIIVHSREAETDTAKLLNEEADKSLTGVLHCFTSKAELAKAGLKLGFYISASGVITFKKADELRDIFQTVPLDKLLIETDAPFLSPTPYRGKRNEPAFVIKTAEMLAEIKQVSLQKIADETTNNFLTLFKKAV